MTDNGPRFKSAKFTAWIAAQRHLKHVRTRKKSPWTNGQIERFFRSIKYEDLYRNDIADGIVLARRRELSHHLQQRPTARGHLDASTS